MGAFDKGNICFHEETKVGIEVQWPFQNLKVNDNAHKVELVRNYNVLTIFNVADFNYFWRMNYYID